MLLQHLLPIGHGDEWDNNLKTITQPTLLTLKMLLEKLKFILSKLEGKAAWGVEGRQLLLYKRYILINVVLAVILYWPTEIISFEKYLKLKQYNVLAPNLGWEGGW